MSYIVVENFSAGLDTRRHPLTAKSGTLQTLKNAHVSRGGEIEKRKKFALFATLPADTFGMEASSDTIYVFGSVATPTMPSGVTYQRLQHPDSLAMTEVVYSTLYGGKPFVIAKFSDGSVYPFWNGSIIRDFVNGVARSGMTLAQLAANLATAITTDNTEFGTGYTATSSGSVITVIGKPGVVFTPSATADSPLSVTAASTISAKEAVAEVLSSGSFAITGGSQTAASYKRGVRYVNVFSLPGITSVRVGASAVNVADGQDILNTASPLFYNTINPMPVPYGGEPERILYVLKDYINANTATHGYSASWYFESGWSGNDPAYLTITANPAIGSDANGRIVQIEFAANPTGIGNLAELIDTATIAVSPYDPTRYIATWGTLAGGSTNAINSVKVDGVEIMGSEQKWDASHSQTMVDVVNRINTYTSPIEYTASFESNKVVLRAMAGTGSTPNGRVISVTTVGNVVVSSVVNFAGGVASQAAISQQAVYTLSGTPSAGKKVTLVVTPTLDSANPIYFGATRVANSTPTSAITFKTKAHITSGSSLFFSGVNQPTKWGDGATGSGFINLSNNFGGNETLVGTALYQGKLAAFARRSVQVWNIDTDPANNSQGQVLSNTGAISPSSIISVGEIDVFYLSDSGVRSLRARDASNAAVVNDVGTPVDGLILAELAAMTDAQKSACPAIIEPIDGRYWLAIGSKVYVYSYFPNSQVAAWSTYEPGFAITKFTTKDGRVYARSGNVVYLYGGTSGTEYDSSEVEVIMPYLDGGKPAHQKTLNGMDMTCEGEWKFFAGMDPLAPSARDIVTTVSKPTFSLGRIMASGKGTHLGIRLVCSAPGYARIANIIAHFALNEAN